jgi:hypothetical protein
MDQYLVIPESIVIEAAEACKDDPTNNFMKVWNAGQEYKAAGLTPVYLLDQNYMDLVVIAKELHKKKLN